MASTAQKWVSLPTTIDKAVASSAKARKRKFEPVPTAVYNAVLTNLTCSKSGESRRVKKNIPDIRGYTEEYNDMPLNLTVNKDKDKKHKKEETHMPRSSFRLYLRRQNKEQEHKKRAENYIRTVELIKRPIELRDPATKILFLASLDLYPKSESGGGPIVIIKQSSAYCDQAYNSSESSESSEKEIPIIEVLSDQDDRCFSTCSNPTDSFLTPEIRVDSYANPEIVASTPKPKKRRLNPKKPKDKAVENVISSAVNRKPLTQRQHNSLSLNKTISTAASISVSIENIASEKDEDWKPFKYESVQQPPEAANPCVQPKVPEIKPDNECDKFGDLESIKRMLAKLHTRIAPAGEKVQLITIE